jgi:sn-glycerol 3-phosphate transport system permease protein
MPAEIAEPAVATDEESSSPRAEATSVRGPRRGGRTVVRYVVLTALAALVLFPVYVTVVNSLLKPVDIASGFHWFPRSPQWHNYSDAWSEGHLGRYLGNSAIVSISITAGQVVTAVLAAYAFAFLRFPLRNTLFVLFLATLMIPGEVTFFTNVSTVRSFGWYDTYAALIVPFLATGFGAFLIRQSFLTVPNDLREAAQLDGYGHLRFLWRIVVPISRPAIGAMALFAFLGAWNQYLWPLVVTKNQRLQTVQIGLRSLRSTQVDQVTVTYAGTVLAFLPIAILLIVFSKQLVRGLTAGAVKG